MSYALSFAPEFFWGTVPLDELKPSECPTSVYQALLSLSDKQWASLARETFGVEPNDLELEMVVHRIIETNICRNLDSPVEIFIDQDGFHSVLVY